MLKRIIIATVLLLILIAFTGCQTVQGMGGDIQWMGEKGSEALE